MLRHLLVHKTLSSVLLSILILGLSFFAWYSIPVEILPKDGVPPYLLVRVNAANPQDPKYIETSMGTNVEGALKTVSQIIGINSSIDDKGISVSLRFKPKTNLDLASIQINEALGPLDEAGLIDLSTVNIVRLNPDAVSILKISVSNPNDETVDINALRDEVRVQLESIRGVARVELIAMENPRYELQVATNILSVNRLKPETFFQLAKPKVLSEKVGHYLDSNFQFPVFVKSESISLDYLFNHILAINHPISLTDISQIKVVGKHQVDVVKYNGNDTYFLEIFPKDGANLLGINDEVMVALEKIRSSRVGSNLKFEAIFNQTDELKSAIMEVFSSLIQAMFITFIIVLAFYKKLNQTLIVNLSIPLTLLVTLLFMYLGRASLNILTLSGLILGIGMVVDNAVLIVDRIDELREKLNLKSAIGNAVMDVSGALVLSSITNALIFLPIAFIDGNDSFIDLLRAFQLPIVGSLAASLFVSLLFLPLVKMRWVGPSSKSAHQNLGFYLRFIRWTYKYRVALSVLCIFSFLYCLDKVMEMDSTDLEAPRDPFISVSVKFSNEIKPPERRTLFLGVEQAFLAKKTELKYKFLVSDLPFGGSTGNLVFYPIVEEDSDEALNSLNDSLKAFVHAHPNQSGVQVTVGQAPYTFNAGRLKLNMMFEAPNQIMAEETVAKMRTYLEKEPGFIDVLLEKDDRAEKQALLIPNMDYLTTLKLDLNHVRNAIAPLLMNLSLGQFQKDGGTYEVQTTIINPQGPWTAERILDLGVPVENKEVPVGSLVETAFENTARGIQRKDGKSLVRMVVYLASDGTNTSEVMKNIRSKMAQFSFPIGMGPSKDESYLRVEEMKKKTNFILLLSVFLIYIVLAAMFESLLIPVAIIFSIPMALIFGAWGLDLFGMSLDVMARLGLVILVGTGVNNAIILIDMILSLRKEGLPRSEAIVLGCAKRLRAVLMTTAIQVISVMPVAMGKSKLMGIPYASLGIVMISGMVFSTIVTVIVLPLLYELFDSIERRLS